MWNETPLHQCQFTDRLLGTLADHWDRLGGSDVVARRPLFIPRHAVEILFDQLLSPRQSVTPAHSEIMADRERFGGSRARSLLGFASTLPKLPPTVVRR